jgi:type I restriction enzyme S subunit
MSWREIALGPAIHVKHGYAFKGEFFADSGEYIVLTPGNFNEEGGFRIRPEKDRAYAGDIPEAYVLGEGDLIVAMTEQGAGLLGSAALVPRANRYLHNQRLGLVDQIDASVLDKRFLYLLFNTRSVRAQISGSASGTKVRHTAPERIYRVRVRVPDVNKQASIAETVLAYDDLIENNRRRMALLEESARLLYREWFVRLRFPGYEHTRITDGVPEGWERKTLGDLCSEIRESVSPDALEPDTPYIGLEHLPRRSISLNDWGKVEQVTSSKSRFKAGEILFGKIRPYFHKVGVAFVDGVASSDAIVICPVDEKLHGLVLMTVSSDEFVAVTSQTMKEGSKMPRADWKQMQAYPVSLPTSGVLRTFDGVIQPIITQLKVLTFANQKLRTARDLLLPRLMNGELLA